MIGMVRYKPQQVVTETATDRLNAALAQFENEQEAKKPQRILWVTENGVRKPILNPACK